MIGRKPERVEQAITAIKEALAQPEQEPKFFTHNVEQPHDWSEWVCPDPKGYLMKCCDCGLVHEAEFGVVRFKSETEREDCEPVNDPNLQAVFRMRRSEQWSPEDTAHRAGGLPMEQSSQQEPVAWEQFHEHMAGPFYKAPPQPEKEPVAWGVFEGNLHDMFFSPSEAQEMADLKGTHAEVRPLYTTPPALAQPEQEPVAWQVMVEDEAMKEFSIKDMARDWCVQQKLSASPYAYWIRPLYTTPPQRKPQYDKTEMNCFVQDLYDKKFTKCCSPSLF